MKKEYVNESKQKKVIDSQITFRIDEFMNQEKFSEGISMLIKLGFRYSVLTRISYITDDSTHTQLKMLGEQINFGLELNEDKYKFIKHIHDVIIDRLDNSMDKYNYDVDSSISIQLLFFTIGKAITKKHTITAKSLGEQKDLVNFNKLRTGLQILPLIPEEKDFGVKLEKIVSDKIDGVKLVDGNLMMFEDSIYKYMSKNINFDHIVDFYQKSTNDKSYIISVYEINKEKFINVYSIVGLLIDKFTYSTLNNNVVIRKSGNVTSYISNTGIYKKEIQVKLGNVYPYKVSDKTSNMLQPDWRIGTLDLETYKDNDISKTYAIGYYVKDSINTYYINDNLDSDEIIVECLDSMLSDKYNGYTFYVHNLSGYDIYFLFRVIIANSDKYQYEPTFRDDSIIGIRLSRKSGKKTISIRIVDSYNLLSRSLNDLCVTFDTPVKKTIFPYEFVNKNTLFYVGKKPDIGFYKNTSRKDYNEIPKSSWSMKNETISYLENDIVSLFCVIEKFTSKIYIDYHVHSTKSLTISSLSMDIYLRRFYNEDIPLIKQKSIYNDIKKSYYGGITEVYKPHGKNLYYYDVNSLYPFSALNDMPGTECVYTDNINKYLEDIDTNLFGFYKCKIITPNNYLGLLPYRCEVGLTMPLGNYEGWYFSEEIKYARENGYKIFVCSGYSFNRVKDVFKEYVESLYKIKSTTKDSVEKAIIKSLLNNLLGRFGLDINKYTTALVSNEEFKKILECRKVRGVKFIEDKVLVGYENDIDKRICENHGIDYKNVINDVKSSKIFNEENYHDVSVAISSAVTSYSRIYMSKVKMSILNKGGYIYYTDTDSIVTNIKLDDHMVGKEIGQFKLEHEILEGYFISNKTYAMKTKKDGIVLRSKGISSRSLSYKDYELLYSGVGIQSTKYETNKSFSQGSATLFQPRYVTISPSSYTKRLKVYNKNNLWIDTKPLYIKKNYYTNSYYSKVLEKLHGISWYHIIMLFIVMLMYFLACVIDENYHSTCIQSNSESFDGSDNTYDCITQQNINARVDSSNKCDTVNNTTQHYVNNYLNLNEIFKKNETIQKHTEISVNDHVLSKIVNNETKSSNNTNNSVILDKIREYYMIDLEKENEKLKKEISILKLKDIEHRINTLNMNKTVEDSLSDLENALRANKEIAKSVKVINDLNKPSISHTRVDSKF